MRGGGPTGPPNGAVSPFVRLALAFGGLMHLVGGLLPSPQPGAPIFYETWIVPGVLKYDQLVHFGVSAIVTFACWEVVGAWVDRRGVPSCGQAFMAALMALGGGALNEAFEFVSALRFDDAFVGGLTNAGWDLVFNAFGAVSAALWLAIVGVLGIERGPAQCSSAAETAMRQPLIRITIRRSPARNPPAKRWGRPVTSSAMAARPYVGAVGGSR